MWRSSPGWEVGVEVEGREGGLTNFPNMHELHGPLISRLTRMSFGVRGVSNKQEESRRKSFEHQKHDSISRVTPSQGELSSSVQL
jgi:hypothetical protein